MSAPSVIRSRELCERLGWSATTLWRHSVSNPGIRAAVLGRGTYSVPMLQRAGVLPADAAAAAPAAELSEADVERIAEAVVRRLASAMGRAG